MMNQVAHDIYVAPMTSEIKHVKRALECLAEKLYRRDLIADHIRVEYRDMSDGHYRFQVIGLRNDVARLTRDWQEMEDERIG